jgi:hypothetical protein
MTSNDNLPQKQTDYTDLIRLRQETEDPDVKRITRWAAKRIDALQKQARDSSPELKELEVRSKKYDYYAKLAKTFATSKMVPSDLGEADLFYIIEMGDSVGLSAPQAIQSIASINGKPALWGDGLLAVVRNSPECEWIREKIEEIDGVTIAGCQTQRKGEPEPVMRTFSTEDALAAGLMPGSDKSPWKKYPKRMLQMRARAWCLRDVYADTLKGFQSAEEMQDIDYVDLSPVSEVEEITLETPPDPAGEALEAAAVPLLMELEQGLAMLYNARTMAELIHAKDEVRAFTWTEDEQIQLNERYADQKATIKGAE